MKNIYLQIIDHQSDSPLVLATVIRTAGSTPQKPGSSALFSEKGLISGTIGGGVVEGRIHKVALENLISKQSGFYEFNLANDISRKGEAICGGHISILVDADPENHRPVFLEIRKSLDKNIPGVLLTMIEKANDNPVIISRYWMTEVIKPALPESIFNKLGPAALNLVLAADPTDFIELDLSNPGAELSAILFMEPVFPPLKLIIAGAGHIGRVLVNLGNLLGFETTVIDDRTEYANYENLPYAGNIIVNEIGDAINEIKKGPDTYVVIVTRGHKDDADALRYCIGSDLAYIGMIGSRKKISEMRNDFIMNGWATPEQWSEIYTPVGLEINSQTVEEIAVSIAAQLIMVKNSKKKKVSSCPAQGLS